MEHTYQIRWDSRQRKLSLNMRLLAALGHPQVMVVEPMGKNGIVLYRSSDPRATRMERVVTYPKRASPRISIGAQAVPGLGLIHGNYTAWIEEGAIYALPY